MLTSCNSTTSSYIALQKPTDATKTKRKVIGVSLWFESGISLPDNHSCECNSTTSDNVQIKDVLDAACRPCHVISQD